MKKQSRCINNVAPYPEFGVICFLRKENSLCNNCKMFESKHPSPSYCCQKCGKPIGWLGRFVEMFYCGLIKHNCK